MRPEDLRFVPAVSRWQLGVSALDNDPLSPWVGEPALFWLGSSRGSSDRADQITAMLHQSIAGRPAGATATAERVRR